jgi:hypothetical protein
MTHNEINSSPACSTDKYSTILVKKTRVGYEGSRYYSRAIRYFKTSSLPIYAGSAQSGRRSSHSRSKNCFYCESISKLDFSASRIFEEIRKKFERNCDPIFGGFSPKWTEAEFREKDSIELSSLNTAMIV